MGQRTPSYMVHDGFRMPMGFPVEGFDSALRYEPHPDDVLISTYPKCGTTWMQNIVWLIVNKGEPLGANQRMTDAIPHIEEVGKEAVEALPVPRLIKTHLPRAMMPLHASARTIYVMRNPFDCAVSFYHHTRGFVHHYDFAQGTFDDYFDCFVTGEVDFGDYFENVLSWFVERSKTNFLFLTYEQMSADARGTIETVGRFLGPELGAAVEDAAILERIVAHSSFSSMSKDQLRWSSERAKGMPEFVRKGEVGDWRNHFSQAQARRMLERIEKTPGADALCQQWPDIMASVADYAT